MPLCTTTSRISTTNKQTNNNSYKNVPSSWNPQLPGAEKYLLSGHTAMKKEKKLHEMPLVISGKWSLPLSHTYHCNNSTLRLLDERLTLQEALTVRNFPFSGSLRRFWMILRAVLVSLRNSVSSTADLSELSASSITNTSYHTGSLTVLVIMAIQGYIARFSL